MKRLRIESMVFGVVLSAACMLCGCDNGNEHHYENKIFINGKSFTSELRVNTEEGMTTMTRTLSVGMGQLENKDIRVRFTPAPEKLNTYRKAYYDSEAVLLPEENYVLEMSEAVISQGTVTSDAVPVTFTGLDELDLSNYRYVLPLSISTPDGLPVLSSARTIYFVVKEASLINVVADIKENFGWPAGGAAVPEDIRPNMKDFDMHDWKNPEPFKDLTNFTVEMLVMLNSYKDRSIEGSAIQTLFGIEDLFLLRVGDARIPESWLQMALGFPPESGGETADRSTSISNGNMRLRLGQWYHIAATFDTGDVRVFINGQPVGSTKYPLPSIDFSAPRSDEMDSRPRCLWLGYSYDSSRWVDGKFAELRFWNRTLTSEELNATNHFYRVSPDSEGLIGYWKLNDGEGSSVAKDYSPYGNDMEFAKTPVWVEVELPAKE